MFKSEIIYPNIMAHNSIESIGENLVKFLKDCREKEILVQSVTISVNSPTTATILKRSPFRKWGYRVTSAFPNW